MIIFLIILALYLILDVIRIISDFNQPKINQPAYVRHFSIPQILFAFFFSPIFWWEEIRHPISRERKKRNKELRALEKKSEKLRKDLFH